MTENKPWDSGGWVSSQPPAPSKKKAKKPDKEKASHRLSVVGIQSIACGVILLLALLLRLAGGEAYTSLRQYFQESLMSNDLLGAMAALWEQPAEETSVALNASPAWGRLPPEGTVAVTVRVNRLATPPLAEGTVTSGYGYRQNPTGEGEQFHRGVDIAAPADSPLSAMYDGTVAQTGESRTLGNYIRIAHGDGLMVLYAHCAEILATEGTVVRAGERVATVGSTGDSTGNHVHIEVAVGETVYNPAGTVPLERYA